MQTMSRTIFSSRIMNPYRAKGARYNILRGHTGVDLDYRTGDELLCPVTGEVIGLTNQVEMGHCLYVRDAQGSVHVFAHLKQFLVNMHDQVKRGQVVAITNNSGTATSGPHLHYEVITTNPIALIDRIMYRKELLFKGYNTDPLLYLKKLYAQYGVDALTLEQIIPSAPEPLLSSQERPINHK